MRRSIYQGLLPVVLLAACTGRGLETSPGSAGPAGPEIGHDCIVLGARLNDPYTVENMSLALAALYPTKASRVVVPATDWYVRFLPSDETQYVRLEEMGLDLLDHPMDYEILREGDWYHDPTLPEDRITWQYSVVKADFDFPPDIPYEVLDKCYIPEENAGTKGDGIDWKAVEREAFRLTGNGELLESPEPIRNDEVPAQSAVNPAGVGISPFSGTKAKESGTPSGRITIVDADLGGEPEGVRGVRVSCNCFVKTARTYTDEQGCYTMNCSFSSRPRYRLVFRNKYGFSIGLNRVLVSASVSTLGPGDPAGLDVSVSPEGDQKMFARCVVNNAGFDYIQTCEKASPEIKSPPSNLRFWLFQHVRSSCAPMMHQGVLVEETRLAELLGEFSFLLRTFLPDVLLGLGGKDSYAEIYSEAMHELAHTSHFMLAGSEYWSRYIRNILKSFLSSGFVAYGVGTEEDHGYCEVAEMWAYCVRHRLYRTRYGVAPGSVGLNYWFHPQILLQLEERGLSLGHIFQILNAEVTGRELLRKKLISYYPEYKSTINQAFARYN